MHITSPVDSVVASVLHSETVTSWDQAFSAKLVLDVLKCLKLSICHTWSK
jgi:hypothetical protein